MSKITTKETQTKYSSLSLQVQDDLTVQVIPNDSHEFLMTTKEVANGYGTSKYAIFKTIQRNSSEFIEGKHIMRGVDILSTLQNKGNIQYNSFLFTKRGIIRLGFFIKSERAKVFRDWAEELIIKLDEQTDLFGAVVPQKKLPAKRQHNRLTKDRLVGILADVARIEDTQLRLSLIEKLGV